MLKKLLAFILIMILLFSQSACFNNRPKNTNYSAPNYIVKDITGDLGLKSVGGIKINSKDQLVIYNSSDGTNKYITVDGTGKIINEIKCDFEGSGQVFAFDADDNLYILAQKYVVEKNGYKIVQNTRQLLVYSSKGEKLKIVEMGKAEMQKDENIYVNNMSIDSKGNIFLVKNNESLEIIDKDGKTLKNPTSGVYGFLDIDEKDDIIAGATGARNVKPFIAYMDLKSNKEIWKKQLDIGYYIYSLYYNKVDKYIYALTNKGVDRYDSEGNLSGMVLDFSKYNLLRDGTYINNMCVDSSGRLYLLINENESLQVKKFEVGDIKTQVENNMPNRKLSKEKKVITLTALFYDRWLETAVSEFQAEHPDIEISVKDYKGAFYGGSDTVEEANKRREEFVKTINTELMAGKGPDIIDFSDLPYRKYIDKNMFLNLSEMMEKDEGYNKAELNFNILDAMKYKGGVYVMPVNYQFEVMFASKTILDGENIKIDDSSWTWDDFMQIAEKVTRDTNNDDVSDQYAAYTLTNKGIFSFLFGSNLNKFVDTEKKKAYFTTTEFINMLKSCKSFNDKKLLFKAGDIQEARDMSSRGGIAFKPYYISDYGILNYYKSNDFNGDVYFLRMPSDKTPDTRGINFGSANMFAINSNTKFRDEAWEFLKLLISKKLQASPSLQNGFPINNEALKELANYSVKYLYMNQKTIDTVNKFIPYIREYQYDEVQVSNIINTEIKDFFSGNKSAEETANIIQNKVTLYLNE